LVTRKFIGNKPFAELLGDDFVGNNEPCLTQMMNQHEKTVIVIGVQQVSDEGKR